MACVDESQVWDAAVDQAWAANQVAVWEADEADEAADQAVVEAADVEKMKMKTKTKHQVEQQQRQT